MGTTLKNDELAQQFLRYYERSVEHRSFPVGTYVAYTQSLATFCELGFSDLCASQDRVGIVMDQSQVGAAAIVASALGVDTKVATFATKKQNGALVAGSPDIVLAVYRSTGPSLRDSALDFSDWRIVPVSSVRHPSVQAFDLEISESYDFFQEMLDNSSAVSQISARMDNFFGLVTDAKVDCEYGVLNLNSYFTCPIHSDDLDITGQGAWIEAYAVMKPVLLDGRMSVSVHLYFTRKFDKKSAKPDGDFSDINYDNADEARMAQLATARVVSAFQEFFQPNVVVRRY